MIRLEAPGAVRWIVRTLEEAGFETWAVGGAVRDALADVESGDWDLTTRARPPELRRLFRRTVPIGIEHGTVGVLARDGTLYEVTTFRRDVETSGRRAVVAFADALDEDLARRDFTINAVAWHPVRRVVHDPYGGGVDMALGILRTVGDPEERFAEDYLRVLRALRFAGRFRLRVEGGTWRALCRAVPGMEILSPERVREELDKVLRGPGRPSGALSLYAASGALALLFPELRALVGTSEGRAEPGDLWSVSLRMVDALPTPDPEGPSGTAAVEPRLVALLHAVGRGPFEAPQDAGGDPEGGPGKGALRDRTHLRAAAILTRLRSSNARIRRVAAWAAALADAPGDPAPAGLRRWLADTGRDAVPGALRLLAARARARGPAADAEGSAGLLRALRRELASDVPLSPDEMALTGRDLIRMGYRPGPAFGEVLRTLHDDVLADPSMNRAERLAERARELLDGAGASAGADEGRGRGPRGEEDDG